jgi:hypothetical protein
VPDPDEPALIPYPSPRALAVLLARRRERKAKARVKHGPTIPADVFVRFTDVVVR